MKKIFLSMLLLLFIGCGNDIYNIQKSTTISKKETMSIIPFANFTQTPLAGYKVAGITEGVFKSKGFNIQKSLWNFPEEDYTLKEIKNIINNTQSDYIVTGYVNEYRYKAGIDGEPVISITIKIYNNKKHKYIYTATISKIGNTYDSLGLITQTSINKILDETNK